MIRVVLVGFFLSVFGGDFWSFWVGAGVLVWRRPGSGGRGPFIFLPVFVLSPLDPFPLWFKLQPFSVGFGSFVGLWALCFFCVSVFLFFLGGSLFNRSGPSSSFYRTLNLPITNQTLKRGKDARVGSFCLAEISRLR